MQTVILHSYCIRKFRIAYRRLENMSESATVFGKMKSGNSGWKTGALCFKGGMNLEFQFTLAGEGTCVRPLYSPTSVRVVSGELIVQTGELEKKFVPTSADDLDTLVAIAEKFESNKIMKHPVQQLINVVEEIGNSAICISEEPAIKYNAAYGGRKRMQRAVDRIPAIRQAFSGTGEQGFQQEIAEEFAGTSQVAESGRKGKGGPDPGKGAPAAKRGKKAAGTSAPDQ